MPAMPFIQAALKATSERIAQELVTPQQQAPDWNDFEWRVAIAVAAIHGVSALLAARLRWQGPPAWQAFLAEQALQGRLRDERTRQLLAQIDSAAQKAQLPLLALKGSALLKLDLYAPGERPMSDVDLLCREQDFEASHALVLSLGYEAGLTSWKHREYQPAGTRHERAFGEHIGNPLKIELHSRILEKLPRREVAITERLFPPAAQPGLNDYPSLAALMQHLLLHAAGNVCVQGIRLIHLHDIAALSPCLRSEDWDALLHAAAWWMLPPLALVDRYFPGRIEPRLLQRAAQGCPPLLRRASARYRLAEHSLSRWSMPLFPGVEWSHTTAEALAWIANRLYPGRKAEALNKQLANSHHALTATGWAQNSRWEKALLVLAGSAPRATTLYSIQSALGYQPPPHDADSPSHIASMRAAL